MRTAILFIAFCVSCFGACSSIPLGYSLGANAGRLGGFVPFPSSAYWHRDVSAATPDAGSAAMIAATTQGGDQRVLSLYPATSNGGSGTVDGYLYQVVDGSVQPRINVYYDTGAAVPGESDPGPAPIPMGPAQQGSLHAGNPYPDYVGASNNDGHVIIIDCYYWVLYEYYNVSWRGHSFHAASGAVFDLLAGDNQRPVMFTSGSVSGLPLFPGFLRDEEIDGTVPITHPIAITMNGISGSGNDFPKHSWVEPASHHQYSFRSNPYWLPNDIPFGSILRLKAGFDISAYPAQAQRIMLAMKAYGLIFLDGGNTIDIYSASGWKWLADALGYMYDHLKLMNDGSNFDVITSGNTVYCDPLYATSGFNGGHTPVCPNSTGTYTAGVIGGGAITGAAPVISSFTGSRSGTTVTLNWASSGASTGLVFVTPYVGAVRGTTVTTMSAPGTTYTLMVQNFYGRTSTTVTP